LRHRVTPQGNGQGGNGDREPSIRGAEEDGTRGFVTILEAVEVWMSTSASGEILLSSLAECVRHGFRGPTFVTLHPDVFRLEYGTIFLFTDGKETKRSVDDVVAAAEKITMDLAERMKRLHERNRIGLATIALGQDADRETMRDIASFLREAQRRVLEERGLIDLVDPPYHEKMFIDAPADDRISREWEEAVRRFVERLSETATV
jgi:hypothetical protein